MRDHQARPAGGASVRTRRDAYPAIVLAMLVLVYAFNFIDRQILGILAVPIRSELRLTDTELGALGGLAFALFYTALAIPVAWLADRRSRTTIITLSFALWSGFTALCGLAGGFWQLFLCRLGVGIGEAGGVAPAYALVADYFPVHRRARALAVYSLGIPLGSAAGILLGGWIASTVNWRMAFLAVGLAGLVLAPLFRLVVREPERGRHDPGDPQPPPSLAAVVAILLARPSFWMMAFGAAFGSMVGYGLMFWLPSFFGRSYGLGLVDVSLLYGAIVLVGGVLGVWAGGWAGDRWGARGPAGYARVPALAYALSIPCYALGMTSDTAPLAFLLFLIPQALSLMWLGPTLAAVQHLVPPTMRATASASFLFVNNLIGLGCGTLVFGLLSDALSARLGAESLRYAMLIGLGFYVPAALLFWAASRRLGRDGRD